MDIKTVIKQLNKHVFIESIIQFGSSLNKKDYRDIDLCIFTSQHLTFNEKLKLIRTLPEKYDLCFYDDLPLHLKKVVLSEGKIVFTKNYLNILKKIQYVDLEYPRYHSFLESYHKKRMVTM